MSYLEESGGYVTIAQQDGDNYILGDGDVAFIVANGSLSPFTGNLSGLTVVASFEASGYPSDARLSGEHTSKLEMGRIENDYGSPVLLEFANGDRLTLTPELPVRDMRSAGLADVTGDGEDDLIVVAVGDPGICSDTNTGYVGFAEGTGSGFSEIEWQDPLGGGLASILIADIDGEPGCEIVTGMYETFCTKTPAGIWVFSPGPR